jgi:hypothetical protein
MRLPKLENYKKEGKIKNVKLKDFPKVERFVNIMNERDKVKLIKTIETICRSSKEYKEYIAYLKKEIDMTQCSFFHKVSNKEGRKVRIEIHHEPFTLYDITHIILEKWIQTGETLNPILIAEEVMKVHYQGRVGLIPLSLTVHNLVHEGKVFIPLQCLYGNYIEFMKEYDQYITQDLKEMLHTKLRMSKDLSTQDLSILEKSYVYLEVDGMTFPTLVE